MVLVVARRLVAREIGDVLGPAHEQHVDAERRHAGEHDFVAAPVLVEREAETAVTVHFDCVAAGNRLVGCILHTSPLHPDHSNAT